uniref:CRAL-TRIO domain-containing protein n=1 Tax=Bursaphelenchus xylophilus TaxID=6326 RepID=A0A1I7RLM0_BURXY
MDGRDRLYSTLSTQLALNPNRDLKRFENDIAGVVDSALSELRNSQKFRGLINKLVVQQRVAAAEAFLSQQAIDDAQADPSQNNHETDGNFELQAKSDSEIVERHQVLPSSSSEADINKKSVPRKLSNGYNVKFKYLRGDVQLKSSQLNKHITKDWTMVVILPNVVLETNEFDIVKITTGSFDQIFTILSQANLHKKTKNIVLALAPKYFKKSCKVREILSRIISYGQGFEGKAKLFVTGFANKNSNAQPKEYCEKLRKFNDTAEGMLAKHDIQFLDLKKFLPIKLNGVDWHKDHPESPEVFNDDIMAWVFKEAMSYAMLSANGTMKKLKRASPRPVEEMEYDEKEIVQKDGKNTFGDKKYFCWGPLKPPIISHEFA